jgi:hypothetical protein
MKAIHIDFVQHPHWRAIWAIVALGLVGFAVTFLPPIWKQHQGQRNLDQSIALLRQQAAPPVAPAKAPAVPRLANSRQAADVLQRDLNGIFSLMEALKEPSVRLHRLGLDNMGGTIQLEYEFDSMLRASSVTVALNAGYPSPPWRLDSISPASPISYLQPGSPGATLFRALWSADLSKL